MSSGRMHACGAGRVALRWQGSDAWLEIFGRCHDRDVGRLHEIILRVVPWDVLIGWMNIWSDVVCR